MSEMVYISEERVKSLMDWEGLFQAIEQALSDVSANTQDRLVIQPPRLIMPIAHRNGTLLAMPGLSERTGVLACKLVTAYLDNPLHYNIPSVLANILLLEPDTGRLKAVVAGTTITEWRTACSSAVATKHLSSKRDVLAILGAGKQGRIHIIAYQNIFSFKKVNLWNRTHEKALRLASQLMQEFGYVVQVFSTAAECAKKADVIVTATYAQQPILNLEDVAPNVLINAVGAGVTHHSELHPDIYEKSAIYVDSIVSARAELKKLFEKKYNIRGELGEVINGLKKAESQGIKVYHSMGMAVADAVSAQLVWDNYQREHLK